MVYKKYIKRNGKIYGPYIYHSKRVDGKVVSEYRGGSKKSKRYNSFFLILGVIVFFGVLIFLLFSSEKVFSGQVTLGLDAEYKQGEILKGKLNLGLKEGEFLPANSKIVFENNGNSREFVLKDIVSEEVSEGNFYLEGKNLEGSGQGYGKLGVSNNYEEVYFELNIYKNEQIFDTEVIEGNTESNEEPQEIVEETTPEVPETIKDIETIEQTQEFEEPQESNELDESLEATEEPQEIVEETTQEVPEATEEPQEIQEVVESSPVTGNFLVRIANSFLGLTPTGQVSLELENTIKGNVKFGEEFVYELSSGETAELIPLSVKTSSGKELSDNSVKVKIQDNKAIVTTNYNEIEEGYGNDFLGEEEIKIPIDLNNLNLDFSEGDLIIRVIYEDFEIINLKSTLKEGLVNSQENKIEIEEPIQNPEENETQEQNKTQIINGSLEGNETLGLNETQDFNETLDLNDTINGSFNIMSVEPLSIQEKAILLSYFGNIPINVVKSEKFRDRIILRYDLGGYEIEFSYDENISPEILEKAMENDRVIWLRDLSKNLDSDKKDTSIQEIDLSNFTNNLTLRNI